MLFLMLTLSTVVTQSLCQLNFTGHKVLGLFPSDEQELEFLRSLTENNDIDAWNHPTALYEKMSIRVSPEVAEHLESELKSKGIDFYVMTDNVQKWIDTEREENPPDDELAGRQENFQVDVYHTFEAITAYIDSVGSRYASVAQVQHLGTTHEGNPLKGLKIGVPRVNKPAIWIDSGIHAREWVAPATSLYIIEQLVKGYDTDPEIKKLLETFDWYIFPVVNPDGYKFTWTYNRMWRKNRAPADFFNPFCVGSDPNRNFDADFGGAGTSSDPCAETFRGRMAFSEAESRAIRDGILRIGSNLKAYISFHSYSQLWMTPYGTSRDFPPDYSDHMKALTAGCNAIQNVHGQYYRYGTIANTIYPATGSSVDWVYRVGKVKYSFAVELRDTGRQGFMLSNSQIIPTAEENFAGLKAIAKIIQAELK